jgi:hypothetical protein
MADSAAAYEVIDTLYLGLMIVVVCFAAGYFIGPKIWKP